MSDFQFKVYTSGQRSHLPSDEAVIWVTTSRLNIGQAVFERLGSPERMRMWHDAPNKAIRIEAAPRGSRQGGRIYRMEGRRSLMVFFNNGPIGLPKGRYTPIDTNIFIHESTQR